MRLLALVILLANPAWGEAHHRVSLWVGSDLAASPSVEWHGIVLVRYELELPRARFVVDYNTDTLRVAVDRLRAGPFELGVIAGGEVFIAGLLTDYWRDGRMDPARGFRASWLDLGSFIKLSRAPSYLELATSVRRWFFARQGGTSPELILPPEAWVGEFRLRYTLWKLAPDRSLWEAQRPFPRLCGVAFGVELGADVRSDVRPWGARVLDPPDLRNDPSRLVLSARQWLRAGVRLGARLRLQLDEVALWMSGADDLDRARVGGLNPYVVPIAGQPWAGHLVSRLAAAQLSLHARVWRELELGLLADAAAVDDLERGERARPGGLYGVGAFADFRLRGWQADLRGGWSPPDGASIFASLGWGWSR